MIQGFYFSATGILTNSYRQDVIANNIANSETVGFKKDLALFQQRPTEARSGGNPTASNRMLERLGGGFLASPTAMDTAQGDLETTDNNLDLGIMGSGYFQVSDQGKTSLTRDGRMMVDRDSQLAMAAGAGRKVLDAGGRPIQFDPGTPTQQITIDDKGNVRQRDGKSVGRISLVEPADPSKIHKTGGNLLAVADGAPLKPAAGIIHSRQVEHSNVEPASELAQLMDAQRQLEANANMIRYQDSTLARLVNDVGKIS